jgi:hypothetical protein
VGNPGRVGNPGLEGNPGREVETNHGSKAGPGDSPPGVDTAVEGTGYSVANARKIRLVGRLGKRSQAPPLLPHMTLLDMHSQAPPWSHHMTL